MTPMRLYRQVLRKCSLLPAAALTIMFGLFSGYTTRHPSVFPDGVCLGQDFF
ncbi:hypothetical protein BO99DRAFT_399696 [Aspergillus violaceofuscus CBS 115571]|uniref:Uncharacterized protein n=1 Tax=Aspergillus violaceofuscus (strain CBS 115571) TaxID=1450538 RepID=A0A2V5HLQ3_ASPV1|nr:hypothetical protein BO99DRAFT_399696 [Aspergillus violaceofuscus CBS 115571]